MLSLYLLITIIFNATNIIITAIEPTSIPTASPTKEKSSIGLVGLVALGLVVFGGIVLIINCRAKHKSKAAPSDALEKDMGSDSTDPSFVDEGNNAKQQVQVAKSTVKVNRLRSPKKTEVDILREPEQVPVDQLRFPRDNASSTKRNNHPSSSQVIEEFHSPMNDMTVDETVLSMERGERPNSQNKVYPAVPKSNLLHGGKRSPSLIQSRPISVQQVEVKTNQKGGRPPEEHLETEQIDTETLEISKTDDTVHPPRPATRTSTAFQDRDGEPTRRFSRDDVVEEFDHGESSSRSQVAAANIHEKKTQQEKAEREAAAKMEAAAVQERKQAQKDTGMREKKAKKEREEAEKREREERKEAERKEKEQREKEKREAMERKREEEEKISSAAGAEREGLRTVAAARERARSKAEEELRDLRERLTAAKESELREKTDRAVNAALEEERRAATASQSLSLQQQQQVLDDTLAKDASLQAQEAAARKEKSIQEEREKARRETEEALRPYRERITALKQQQTEQEAGYADALAAAVLAAETDGRERCREELTKLRAEVLEITRRAEVEREQNKVSFIRENKKRKELHNKLLELQGNIRVFCRVRPMVAVEIASGKNANVAEFVSDEEITITPEAGAKVPFEFDRVFPPGSTQESVFEQVKPTCQSALDGYNVCLFAYGQTGSGKTYTMEGYGGDKGVSPRATAELFHLIGQMTSHWQFEVRFAMVEIYNETIRDLLNTSTEKPKLDVRQGPDGNTVPGLIEKLVSSAEEVTNLMAEGQARRAIGSHNMNAGSSRSHSILTLTFKGQSVTDHRVTNGKLHLIDLAGSERVGKTDATGEMLREATFINKSLSALGEVINSLGSKGKNNHVPYRNSKLTFLLQDSLGGNSKVMMFVNISPAVYNVSETLSSLNFASRCRNTELGQAKKNTGVSEKTMSKRSSASTTSLHR